MRHVTRTHGADLDPHRVGVDINRVNSDEHTSILSVSTNQQIAAWSGARGSP